MENVHINILTAMAEDIEYENYYFTNELKGMKVVQVTQENLVL